MMDCRQVQQLLPLWIGQDLSDASQCSQIAKHLQQCPKCDGHRAGLQNSLEALQSSTVGLLSTELVRRSLWPELVSRIARWEGDRRRERFNGWIPASVMALAVALMVAVSIPSIQEVFFGEAANVANTGNWFDHDFRGELDLRTPTGRGPDAAASRQGGQGTPVNLTRDQW